MEFFDVNVPTIEGTLPTPDMKHFCSSNTASIIAYLESTWTECISKNTVLPTETFHQYSLQTEVDTHHTNEVKQDTTDVGGTTDTEIQGNTNATMTMHESDAFELKQDEPGTIEQETKQSAKRPAIEHPHSTRHAHSPLTYKQFTTPASHPSCPTPVRKKSLDKAFAFGTYSTQVSYKTCHNTWQTIYQ